MKPECFPPIIAEQCPQIPYYPITVVYGKDVHALHSGAQTLDASCINFYDEGPPPLFLDSMLRQLKNQPRAFRTVERLFFALANEDIGGNINPARKFRITAKHAIVVWGKESYTLDQLPASHQMLLLMLIRWQSTPCIVCVGPERMVLPNTSTSEYLQILKDEYKKPIILFTKSNVFVQMLIKTIPALCQFYHME